MPVYCESSLTESARPTSVPPKTTGTSLKARSCMPTTKASGSIPSAMIRSTLRSRYLWSIESRISCCSLGLGNRFASRYSLYSSIWNVEFCSMATICWSRSISAGDERPNSWKIRTRRTCFTGAAELTCGESSATVTIAKSPIDCAVPLKFAFQRFVTLTAVEEDSPLVLRKRTQPPSYIASWKRIQLRNKNRLISLQVQPFD